MNAPARDPLNQLDQPVHPWVVKVVGGVLLSIGVAFGAFLLWFSYRVLLPKLPTDPWIFVFQAVVAVVALFCLSVGYRLFLGRPNRYGSILGPASWRILGGFWSLLTICLAGGAFLADKSSLDFMETMVWSIIFSGSFAYYCLRASRRVMVRRTQGQSAL